MSNFTDFISSGGGASFPTIFLHNSQTWVPPQDGNIMIHVIGAGGSGAASSSAISESGAAGGYCRKNSLAVTTSGSFTVVIGAGGASVIGVSGAGTIGGTTSVNGTGLGAALRGFGGAGGAVSNNTFTAGGVATGGDVNHTGGRGGYSRGGGAVGLTGTGLDGGQGSDYTLSFGGSCDILGDFYFSSLGQISGSIGTKGIYIGSSMKASSRPAGPLAGGGGMAVVSNTGIVAGDASIGGGGGFSYSNTVTNVCSGRGGEGCVVIQYIP